MPSFRLSAAGRLGITVREKPVESTDVDGEGLGLGVAEGVGDRERVSGGFGGRNIHTAGVGRPDWIGLRLELDRFGVGHAVAELDGLAATNLSGKGVKGLDGELLAAHLVEGGAVILTLFFCGGLSGAILEGAVLPPAGKENPHAYKGGNHNDASGVENRVLKKRFARRIRFGCLKQQGCLPPEVRLLEKCCGKREVKKNSDKVGQRFEARANSRQVMSWMFC